MIVGFPPFHSPNKKNLDKRIMSGVVKFPTDISEDSKDLILWLLAKNPEDRPHDFSEIKKHSFFNDIHWGRIAKKQAMPPWIPDLYKWHVPKRFSSIPLKNVFLRVQKDEKIKSPSWNPRPKVTKNQNG